MQVNSSVKKISESIVYHLTMIKLFISFDFCFRRLAKMSSGPETHFFLIENNTIC